MEQFLFGTDRYPSYVLMFSIIIFFSCDISSVLVPYLTSYIIKINGTITFVEVIRESCEHINYINQVSEQRDILPSLCR